METKKLLTTVVVFAVVLAAMSTVIEAQRGGSGGGSGGGGGHHLSVNAGNDNNNVGNNAGDNNNAGIEVSVSTDKQRYVLGEPIEITVTAYNPTDSTVGVYYEGGCTVLTYVIDGYIGSGTYVDENGTDLGGVADAVYCPPGTYIFQPDETITRTFVRDAGTFFGDDYVPLPIGRHTVVGTISGNSQYESRPITIQVVDSNNGGMG